MYVYYYRQNPRVSVDIFPACANTVTQEQQIVVCTHKMYLICISVSAVMKHWDVSTEAVCPSSHILPTNTLEKQTDLSCSWPLKNFCCPESTNLGSLCSQWVKFEVTCASYMENSNSLSLQVYCQLRNWLGWKMYFAKYTSFMVVFERAYKPRLIYVHSLQGFFSAAGVLIVTVAQDDCLSQMDVMRAFTGAGAQAGTHVCRRVCFQRGKRGKGWVQRQLWMMRCGMCWSVSWPGGIGAGLGCFSVQPSLSWWVVFVRAVEFLWCRCYQTFCMGVCSQKNWPAPLKNFDVREGKKRMDIKRMKKSELPWAKRNCTQKENLSWEKPDFGVRSKSNYVTGREGRRHGDVLHFPALP